MKEILEIGCGSGGDLATLAEFGKVTGVERSVILAERARKRNRKRPAGVSTFVVVWAEPRQTRPSPLPLMTR